MRTPIPHAFVLLALLFAARPSRASGVQIHPLPMSATSSAEMRPISVKPVAPDLSPGDRVPDAVESELAKSQPFPSAVVQGKHYYAPSNCSVEAAELTTPLMSSGRAALRVSGVAANGKRCNAYAFVDVRVTADALVATRPIREGAPLEGSVRMVRREISNGETPLTSLPEGSLASRSLATGQMIQNELVRAKGLNVGTAVRVLVHIGALSLEESGRVTRCSDPHDFAHACAQVASGKRVEGTYQNGAILVGAQ